MGNYLSEAENFIQNEKEFHLGFLPSEASNPLTANLDLDFAAATTRGVASFFACDNALHPFLKAALESAEFAALRNAVKRAFNNGGRLILSGCGATGRISILMEAMWRDMHPGDDRVVALMTGGELALARAVEHFEDYPEGGARQVADLNVCDRDVLVGITATGETASIIGTAIEAANRGAAVFMLICVPKELPPSRLERCRKLYSLPNVTVISMPCGGMAITGSTRMQSSTLEMLVACAAIEEADGGSAAGYPAALQRLTASLLRPENLEAVAGYIDFEAATYCENGMIDYHPGDYLLDVLNDTTERPPTFRVPPFARRGDTAATQPWAFVRDMRYSTREAWLHCFRREPRGLNWQAEDYAAMGQAVKLMAKGVPQLNTEKIYDFPIGKEPLPERENAAPVYIGVKDDGRIIITQPDGVYTIVPDVVPTPMAVFRHIAIKLVMNTISSSVMVKMGRVRGNWMTHLDLSNKKLVDRAVRIVAGLCGLEYREACIEIFRTIEELGGTVGVPVVNHTLKRLGR